MIEAIFKAALAFYIIFAFIDAADDIKKVSKDVHQIKEKVIWDRNY